MGVRVTVPDLDRDPTVEALGGLDATAGMVVQTGADAFTKRSIAVSGSNISVANGSGASGDPTLSLASVLQNTTASFTTADETKLDGIEALADVTDAANVAAAGAVMAAGGDASATVVTSTGGTTSLTLAARFSFERYLEDFGAVGDGSTDDTAAITAALAAMTVGQCIKARPGKVYCYTNIDIPHITDTNIHNGFLCSGGKATLKRIAGGTSTYGIAPARWKTANADKAFSSGPWIFSNIIFDANGLCDAGVIVKNFNTKFYECEFKGALVVDCLLTRQNQDASNGTSSYQSENGWWRCRFHSNGSSAAFRSQGTAADDTDASTDGWLIDCAVNGRLVTPYGFLLGNAGGWHIENNHNYSTTSDDLLIKRVGNIGSLAGNTFEERVQFQEVAAAGDVVTIGGNNFWGGVLVTFKDDTSAEVLVLNDAYFSTTVSAVDGVFTLTTTRSQKTVILNSPNFRATSPIVRTTAGTIIVNDGTDGNGPMGHQIWDDGAASGPIRRRVRVSTSPAVSDVLGRDTYEGKDSGGNDTVYAALEGLIADPTNASEDGQWRVKLMIGGSEVTGLTVSPQLTQSIAGGSTAGYEFVGEGSVVGTLRRYGSSGIGPIFGGYGARGTISSTSSINQFDELVRVTAGGYSSSAFRDAGYIRHYVFAATPSSTDMEGQWRIEACAAGSASITEIGRFSHANGFAMFGANTVVDAARGIRGRSYTSTELDAIGNAVNTTAKAAGKMVWNSTVSKPVWAVGSTAASVWVDGAGTTINTPV